MKKQHEQELTSLAAQSYFEDCTFNVTFIHKDKILKAIKRMEDYPCWMSCHLTKEGVYAARDMRGNMIRILKEEVGL